MNKKLLAKIFQPKYLFVMLCFVTFCWGLLAVIFTTGSYLVCIVEKKINCLEDEYLPQLIILVGGIDTGFIFHLLMTIGQYTKWRKRKNETVH